MSFILEENYAIARFSNTRYRILEYIIVRKSNPDRLIGINRFHNGRLINVFVENYYQRELINLLLRVSTYTHIIMLRILRNVYYVNVRMRYSVQELPFVLKTWRYK